MTIGRDWRMGRRDFLQTTAGGALALTIGTPPAAAEDHQARHNMLVFGERAVFLSHLPMFDGLSADGTDFASPHRYQVILEAAFTSAQLDTYVKDRQANPGSRFYTLGPAPFVLSLFHRQRFSWPPGGGTEQSGTRSAEYPGQGRASCAWPEIRSAREQAGGAGISAPWPRPRAVRGARHFRAAGLRSSSAGRLDRRRADRPRPEPGYPVAIPGRKNVAAERLRQGQRIEAMLRIGSAAPAKVQLDVGPQIYFEEGELLVPPTFDQTDEEKKG